MNSRGRSRLLRPASFVISLALAALPLVAARAQVAQITGRITESGTGRPLQGARVTIVETGVGAISNHEGRYELRRGTLDRDLTLRVILLGYSPVARKIPASSASGVIDIEMAPRVLSLDEVVVTGTAGPTRVREVGHSIARIEPSRISEPIVSIDNMLAGKVPGMSVLQSSGLAASGSQIRLRGNTSVALSNQPLVYVDGVRIRSDGYPRNAPQSGNVLRGANDVPSPLNDIDPSDVERVEIVRGPAATTLYGTEAAAGVIQIFTKRGTAGTPIWTTQLEVGLDHVQKFGTTDEPYMRLEPWLKTARRAGYSVAASGGGDLGYYISGNYDAIQGVLPNDHEKRQTLRGNFDFSPAGKLALSWSSSFSSDDIRNTASGQNIQGLTFNAYRGDTNPTGTPGKESLDRLLAWDITTALHHFIGGLTANYTMSERMSHAITVGYDRAESEMRSLRPFGFVFTPQGVLSSERWTSTTITADYLGRARLFRGKHLGATLAWGGQSIATDVGSVAGYAESFSGPGEPTLSSGALTLSFENRSRGRTGGAFSQIVFDFSDRLFLTAGMRLDGNSAFGEDFGLQSYPRVSASYVISDEGFWPSVLGRMKLRAAYGHAGRAPRSFDAQRTWSSGGFDGKPSFLPLSIGNPLLGPETTAETEVGFDGSFLKERVTTEVTFFRRNTRNALFPVTQPPSLGFLGAQLANVGALRTAGFEISVSAALLTSQRLVWDAGIDFAGNRNVVRGLGGAPPFVIGEQGWIIEGFSAPVVRGTFVRNASALEDPEIENQHVFGPNLPTRTVGVRSTLRLAHGIELAARAEYSGGNFLHDNASRNLAASGAWPVCNQAYQSVKDGNANLLTAWERVWCRPLSVPFDGPIWPADFIRLRALTLTVPVPGRFMTRHRGTLSLSARNFLLWKNPDMLVFDPEMAGRDGMNSPVRTIEAQVPPAAGITFAFKAAYW
jgi:outer membrane receptor protein involved in Fe transport